MARTSQRRETMLPRSIHSKVTRYVYIEDVDNYISSEEVWKQMGIANDSNVIHKRITIDRRGKMTRVAVLIYNRSRHAKAAAETFDRKQIGNQSVTSYYGPHYLMNNLRDEARGEIYVFGYGLRPEEEDIRFWFLHFGPVMSVNVIRNHNGDSTGAVVRLESLYKALYAELALDGMPMGPGVISVIANRSATRNSYIAPPDKLSKHIIRPVTNVCPRFRLCVIQ